MKTRNKLLLFVSLMVIIYAALDIALGFMAVSDGTTAQLDSTLTEQIFSFAKWTVTTGAIITVTKTIKGEDGEPPSPDDEPNEEECNDEPVG